jgi:enoyl-CoA hydratase/carnithine racemase
MSDVVTYEVHQHVALVTLNRPEALNAWTTDMGREYLRHMDEAAVDSDVRAVVVTGAGRAFSAGADISMIRGLMSGRRPPPESVRRDDLVEPAVPKPVIAAINGPCVGLGLVRALFCDVRFLSADAEITTLFAQRGLVAEHGVSWLLPRIVGLSRALDLLLSSRPVGSAEALRIGLVDHVVDDACTAAVEYAQRIAQVCSPAAMRDIKRQVWSDTNRPLSESIERSIALMEGSFRRPDLAEGVVSYLEKRPADFPPLSE